MRPKEGRRVGADERTYRRRNLLPALLGPREKEGRDRLQHLVSVPGPSTHRDVRNATTPLVQRKAGRLAGICLQPDVGQVPFRQALP